MVAADLPIFAFTIARGVAEEKYRDAMYDRFEVPSHVSVLARLKFMVRMNAPTLSLLILPWTHHLACLQVTELTVVYVKGLLLHASPHACLKSTGNSNGLQKVTIMKHKVRSQVEVRNYRQI